MGTEMSKSAVGHPWTFNPEIDLKLERTLDVPVELVYELWTTPAHLKEFFCPRPWYVSEAELDVRPGGIFRTVMNGPNGERFDNVGCYLDVVPNRRLVWTDALTAGWRPAEKPFMTAALLLEPAGAGTSYVAYAFHRNVDARKQHEAMGFHEGWGTVADQLAAYARKLRG
jgi:uncharacterized protein YndB with AHSA1/START domain